MDDASLDDFLDDRSEDEGDPATTDESTPEAAPEQDSDNGAQTVASDGIEPAAPTYSWHGDTAACAQCGTPVDRRWRDGEQLVCHECKEW